MILVLLALLVLLLFLLVSTIFNVWMFRALCDGKEREVQLLARLQDGEMVRNAEVEDPSTMIRKLRQDR